MLKMATSFQHLSRWILQGWLVACIVLARQQITHTCDPVKQYEHLGRCCMKCEPGKYMSTKCTSTTDTVCLPCGADQYIDVWNEEEKCWLQKLCDSGKGLVVLSHGNSTFERKCACIPGYHLNRDYEFCKRNTECGPGFGVEQPPGRDTDTVCKPCLLGQFSNINSSAEKCRPWTNCTELGKAQKSSGTSFSDAVCDKANTTADTATTLTDGDALVPILIVLLLFATLASASIVVLICCRKRVKTLTVNLQRWLHEYCSRGEKDKCCSNFNNKHLENTCLQLSDGVPLFTKDDKSFYAQDMCCSEGHVLSGDTGLESGHSESEDVPISASTNSCKDQPKHLPTEDEYVDRGHQRFFWSTAVMGQLEHQSAPPFSEPLEVGENDCFSQCFMGTECFFDSEDSHSSDHSCGAEYAHPSSSSSVQTACNCMGAFHGAQGTAVAASYANLDMCHSYDDLLRDSYSKEMDHFDIGNKISSEALEHEHYPRYACESDGVCADEDISANGIREKSHRQDSSETNHPSTKRSTSQASSTSSSSSSVSPTPSGNVTGNSNSTFISSGQVMNFKGDIIVVYVTQNSQEASTTAGATDGNIGNPVQEENQSHSDSFVGNTQQSKEKCVVLPLEGSVPSASLDFETGLGPTVQEGSPGINNTCHNSPGVVLLPVQEEGKPKPFIQ
ncbi:tumor necrosis factor receptor superfamily member 11A [Lissotriton helveticus]